MRTRYTPTGDEGHCATHGWLPLNTTNFAWSAARSEYVGHSCRDCRRAYQRAARSAAGVTGSGPRRARRVAGRKFGIEIEFIGNLWDAERHIRQAFADAGLNLIVKHGGYSARATGRTFIIAPDGSVAGGGEVKTPPLSGEAGRLAVVAVCVGLAAAGATVTKACGLHVHHDARTYDLDAFKMMVNNWNDTQDVIDHLVSPSRRAGRNTYCKPFRAADLVKVADLRTMDRAQARYALSGDRYRCLNFQSYGKHGTMEVRQHQGTLDATKMWAWVRFGQSMMTAAAAGHRMDNVTSVTDLVVRLMDNGGLESDIADYLVARSAELDIREVRYAAGRRVS